MTKTSNSKNDIFQLDDSKYIEKKCSNVKTDEIYITEDKLVNILTEYENKEKQLNKWQVPASYAVTFGLTLFTTKEYNDILIFGDKLEIKSIIITFLIIAIFLMIKHLIAHYRFGKEIEIRKLVKIIKNEMDKPNGNRKRKSTISNTLDSPIRGLLKKFMCYFTFLK